MNRLKSPVMWAGILSGIIVTYNAIATQFGYPLLDNEIANTIVNIICTIITAISSINNPTNKTGI